MYVCAYDTLCNALRERYVQLRRTAALLRERSESSSRPRFQLSGDGATGLSQCETRLHLSQHEQLHRNCEREVYHMKNYEGHAQCWSGARGPRSFREASAPITPADEEVCEVFGDYGAMVDYR